MTERSPKENDPEKEKQNDGDGYQGNKSIEDLPLELIEKMVRRLDVEDVQKVMMLNRRLYASYAGDPSIVFGKKVALVSLTENLNWIKKFEDSPPIQLDANLLPFIKRINSCYELKVLFKRKPLIPFKKHPDSQKIELDYDGHRHLIKRVASGDELCIWTGVGPCDIDEIHKTSLEQLKSVNRLELAVESIIGLTKFFTHFHASVNEYANIDIRIKSFEKDQSVSDLLGNFIETRLTDCEEIRLECSFEELFHVCYQALKKTRVKMIEMKEGNLFLAVQWIVKHGIPSKMPEAGFFTWTFISGEKLDEIISSLTKYPGMEEIVGENRVPLLQQAKKLWDYGDFDKVALCLRQKIDLTKDCIYVIHGVERYGYFGVKYYMEFYAFYILSTSIE